jgi:hypothetical protein
MVRPSDRVINFDGRRLSQTNQGSDLRDLRVHLSDAPFG